MERELVEVGFQVGGIGAGGQVLGGLLEAEDLAALGVAQAGVLGMSNLKFRYQLSLFTKRKALNLLF